MSTKYDKSILEKFILIDKLSYEEIGRIYNCSGSNIKKVAKRLGIDLPVKRKINPKETFGKGNGKQTYCKECSKNISHKFGNVFCDIGCFSKYHRKKKYEDFISNPEKYNRANYIPKWIKPILLEEQNNKCSICGLENKWNNKELIFILDHIDGNAANNKKENLRLICHNCDSQLDTYKSKNKNGARHYYRYRYNGTEE